MLDLAWNSKGNSVFQEVSHYTESNDEVKMIKLLCAVKKRRTLCHDSLGDLKVFLLSTESYLGMPTYSRNSGITSFNKTALTFQHYFYEFHRQFVTLGN